jgi:hypothetical protein
MKKRRGRNRMRKMNRKVEDEKGEWGTGREKWIGRGGGREEVKTGKIL